jgi:hypothetical protein
MGSCFKMGHVSKLVHDCSWLGHVSNWVMCQNWFDCSWLGSCVKTGSRLFVVGSCVKTGSRLFVVGSCVGSRLFVVQKHSSGDFNTKTLKKMRLVPFYVYIYTVCRLRACRLYTR